MNRRQLRHSIKDSEEDPTVPSAPRDRLMNLIVDISTVASAEVDCI